MDFARCPGCQSTSWEDLHAIVEGIPTRFRCIRCGHVIKLGRCAACGAADWQRLSDMYEKESKKPVVRFKCGGCKRVVGVMLD